jgi:uncharacterized protein with FMN-binding domain
MRRAVAALVVTAVALVALASYDTHPPRRPPPQPPALHASPTPTPTPAPGTRTARGPVITTPFSVIQVRAVLRGRRLAGVETVALSGSDPHTEALNARAEPILRESALEAGSARIEVVSGATYTSESWRDSLQAAIDAARARG